MGVMNLNLDLFVHRQLVQAVDYVVDVDVDVAVDDAYSDYVDVTEGDRNGLRWLVAHEQLDNSGVEYYHY